jgi:hypothetical protein
MQDGSWLLMRRAGPTASLARRGLSPLALPAPELTVAPCRASTWGHRPWEWAILRVWTAGLDDCSAVQ